MIKRVLGGGSLGLVLVFALAQQSHGFQLELLQQLDSLTAKAWTLEDGLPVNTVNRVAQDEKGYLWLTTYDGLVRFDGLNFKVFNFSNTPAMPFNRTTQIYIQENDYMWVALEHGGVVRQKEGDFKYFGTEEGMPNSDITKIFEDAYGRLLFVTLEGLYAFEDEKFRKFYKGLNVEQNQITRTYIDPLDESVWLTTHDGLVHIVDTTISVFDISKDVSKNLVRSVLRDESGRLLVGSDNGIYEYSNGELVPSLEFNRFKNHQIKDLYKDKYSTLINTSEGLFLKQKEGYKNLNGGYPNEDVFIYDFYRDSYGTLWMINNRGKVYTLTQEDFKVFEEIKSLSDIAFSSITEDRERNIWMGTLQNGLIRLDKSLVRTVSVKEGLSGGNILGLFEDSRGRYWVGTRGNGLNLIDGKSITHLNRSTGLETNIVQTITEDENGNIWIGHFQKGIDRISNGEITHYDLYTDYEANDIHALYTSSNGTIWAGTYAGLVKFDPVNEEHIQYTRRDGMLGEKIRYITEDKEGDLWLASLDGGISEFKDGKFTNYSMDAGLSSNNIRSIYIDDDEVIWVGSENNGLNRIKDGEIDFVSVQNGLPDHIVHWVSESEDGFLWISTNKGICRINKEELNEFLDGERSEFQLNHFDQSEGMRSPEGNGSFQEAGIKTKHNTLWFSTQDGVAILDRNNAIGNKGFPSVTIENIETRDSTYAVDSTNTIILSTGINDLRINYHAITFKNPDQTKYRYKLTGFQDDWVESEVMEALYSDLPPQTFEFILQATNSDGVWGTNAESLIITVQPRYYQKIWFYFLVTALLIAVYYLIIRFRYRMLISRQEKMQAIIESQTKQLRAEKKTIEQQAAHLEEVNKTKDRFFSIIAHDLRNPFQAMIGFSDILYSKIDDIEKDELKEGIEVIRNSSKALHDLTENLLNWASLQTGRVTVEPTRFALREVISKNVELFFQASQQKNITLTLQTDESIELEADKNMIDTIIRNLLSNAIKFTKNDGNISLKTQTINKRCKITITDDGIGMSSEIIDGIMNLDSQSMRSGTNNETGTGLGLILCNEMIAMNNGTLNIESEEGKGTTFTVDLPIISIK
ncbi:MAG: hypothetical protein JXR20_05540 [Balneola sp.]